MSWKADTEAALMIVKGKDGPPSLDEAARQLDVAVEDLDPDFGVVAIDPDRGLYSVRVDASKLGRGFEEGQGPFSDPDISPMR